MSCLYKLAFPFHSPIITMSVVVCFYGNVCDAAFSFILGKIMEHLYGQTLSESHMRLFCMEITRFDSRGRNNKSSEAIVVQNYCLTKLTRRSDKFT